MLINSHAVNVIMTPEMGQHCRNIKFILSVMLLGFVPLDGILGLVTALCISPAAVLDIMELSGL
jgi:hypothetical protein